MVSTQRKEELAVAFMKDGSWEDFLDSINSVAELDELVPHIKEAAQDTSKRSFDVEIYYTRENLKRWPDPKLEDWFRKEFPLVSARLDTPQKIRVFLRAAYTRKEVDCYKGVSVSTLASVFEEIIRKHDIEGNNIVRFAHYYGNAWRDALRILYHSQHPYWAVTRMMLPGLTCRGTDSDGLFVDWRTKEE